METLKRKTKCVLWVATWVGIALFHSGCGAKKNVAGGGVPRTSEATHCTSVQSYTEGVVIQGSARYQYFRAAPVFGLTTDAGGDPFENPIRQAEVVLRDQAGTIVQCGETNQAGEYTLIAPKPQSEQGATYSVEVNSRGYNSLVKASVLDAPSTKRFYTLNTEIAIESNQTNRIVPPLVAPARVSQDSAFQELEGGAFHIFDQILKTNEFLRDNTTHASCSLCVEFTEAPKVTLYWKKGFNPAAYLNESVGLSFFDASGYIDPSPSLYILGGIGGDVDAADTDHFDTSVIIHEYGHFLERAFWRTDSPGGFHSGNMIIDPRLAFSEGFANYLPSLVMGTTYYIDTLGSPDTGSGRVGIYLDLESEPRPNDATGRDRILTTSPIGEGVYREVSVSRLLYDYTDAEADETYNSQGHQSPPAIETAHFPFAYVWLALTNSTFGLKASHQRFVSSGHFNRALFDALSQGYSGSDLSVQIEGYHSARIGEFQTNGTQEYAQLLKPSATSCQRLMTPVVFRTSDGYSYPDLFASSDFFRIDHPGGVFNLSLEYTAANPSNPPDLDLYVYREVHAISEKNDIVAASDKCRIVSNSCPTAEAPLGTESISRTLPAGTYMVHVYAYTSSNFSGSAATYELKRGSQSLCDDQ